MLLNRFLFPAPHPAHYDLKSHEEDLFWIPPNNRKEVSIPCMFYSPRPSALSIDFLMIFSHGNGCDIGTMQSTLATFSQTLNIYVISFEYPSYGLCTGTKPNQETINNHADRTYDFVRQVLQWPEERIILYGHSIGSGAACYLASTRRVTGLILQSPYTAISHLVHEKVGRLSWLVGGSSWNNLEAMKNITCPVLFIHGRDDTLIPPAHSETLHTACSNIEGTKLILLNREHHNSMTDRTLLRYLDPFVTQLKRIVPRGIPSFQTEISKIYRQKPAEESVSSKSFSLWSYSGSMTTSLTDSVRSKSSKSNDT